MHSFYVYAWTRPDTGEIFYIGKGKGDRDIDLWRRGQHFKYVVQKLQQNGMAPTVVRVAENLSEQEAFDLERAEIARIGRKDLGLGPLVNKTEGGEGSSGYVPSAEALEKVSASLLRHYQDPAARQRQSDNLRKRYSDAAEREKTSLANLKAYALDPTRGPAHSIALKKLYENPASRQKLSDAISRRYEDPAEREKASLAARMSPPRKSNTSGFKGVTFVKESGFWMAKIRVDDKHRNLGTYATKELAALAYDRAAADAWPGGCFLNFPERIGEVLTVTRQPMHGQWAGPRRGGSSRFKGVSFHKGHGKWSAYISIGRETRRLGYHPSERESALAYDFAAYAAWGDQCYLNFPDEVSKPSVAA